MLLRFVVSYARDRVASPIRTRTDYIGTLMFCIACSVAEEAARGPRVR
jgi:hypothetical protein